MVQRPRGKRRQAPKLVEVWHLKPGTRFRSADIEMELVYANQCRAHCKVLVGERVSDYIDIAPMAQVEVLK